MQDVTTGAPPVGADHDLFNRKNLLIASSTRHDPGILVQSDMVVVRGPYTVRSWARHFVLPCVPPAHFLFYAHPQRQPV